MVAVVEQACCEALSPKKLLKIGELAKQTDVAVGTIRYYESLGLLTPVERSENGYRYYDGEAIKRLQFIKKAQSLQFSLSEIQQIVGVRSHGSPACPLVRGLLKKKIADLEEQIYRMKALKDELEAYQESWLSRPLDDPCSKELCSMIEEVACRDIPVHNLRGE
ncbi:heavy metal-responsive transcriptional regulator (plasmid) [Nostoc sp. C052]|uniref:heavy metal-responsive transcriptional regulator n=1 Tax=Nostoc sp. C052 TaxID=2576902 RepID=UPI0015C2FDDD|nr:heavy metal-responsive transcriptional regulator [Nostoc sp. C052]QLE46281.1 heavy metal-responsive transcriptional regulator [Nostoc sp. C052]